MKMIPDYQRKKQIQNVVGVYKLKREKNNPNVIKGKDYEFKSIEQKKIR